MPSLPNTDLYKDPEHISDLIREVMVPDLALLWEIPFTYTETTAIIAKRENYSADTEPKKIEPALGGTIESAWPYMGITLGESVPLNTAMRKVATAFADKDLRNPTFENDARKVYTEMAWVIADQINTDLFAQLIAGASAQTTYFTAKASGETWDGNCDPIGCVRAIAQDMNAQRGYKLETVILNSANYYEMFDNIESPDIDMEYVRTKIAVQRSFYDQVTYLTTPGVKVIGVTEGISEGAIMGIGSFKGTPCVENFAYYDPVYTRKPLGDSSENARQGVGPANIPLNVHTWDAPDGFTHNIYAWVDSTAHVARPYGVFYSASGI